MFRYKASVNKRLQKQRLQRFHQREAINMIIDTENLIDNDDDTESSNDEFKTTDSEPIDSTTRPSFCCSSNLFKPVDYREDEFDNDHILENTSSNFENSLPLFKGSSISVQEAMRKLTSFYLDFNLNKQAVIRLLRIIKNLLPSPNNLPTTWKSVMKVFNFVSSSRKTFLCSQCFERCEKRSNGEKICQNSKCTQSKRMMKSTQLVELIHMDIRSQIQSVLRRNQYLLNQASLYPKTDVCFADYYRNFTGESINRVTLIVHTDGAPLIKLSKINLWPCFASLVELPPPVRDYQKNIIVLALWSSKIKPDPNVFLHETIGELKYLIEHGTSIFIDNKEFRITLRTQCFISDLPAKSLFCRTINFNGYSACSECCSTGTKKDQSLSRTMRTLSKISSQSTLSTDCEWNSTHNMVLYPFIRNDLTPRTHAGYLNSAREAQRRSNGNKDVSISGIKGFSTLFQIFEYPRQILFDYMHLICINHVPCLIKRWCAEIDKSAIHAIDECLDQLRLPHNLKVAYTESIVNAGQWKARANRVFVLNVGAPVVIPHIPILHASHFLIYSMAIKILHAPDSVEEIDFAEQLMNYYCQTAPLIHGPSIELFSLHAHIHLANQVRRHGGLAHTSAFAFESCIRFVEKKAHGSKHLASQIAYWIELQSMMKSESFQIPQPMTVNEIKWSDSRIVPYQAILSEQLSVCGIDGCTAKLYLRFKHVFVTFHTTIYDNPFKCRSFIVSFVNTNDTSIQYGDIIVFVRKESCVYALVQQYTSGSKSMTDYVDIPVDLHSKANRLFPLLQRSDRFLLIPVEMIRHKCASVLVDDLFCLTEIRIDYEHD